MKEDAVPEKRQLNIGGNVHGPVVFGDNNVTHTAPVPAPVDETESVGPLGAEDPARIGPFRLAGWLGEGAMGRVYLGRTGGGRPVAVKVVRPEMARRPGFRERFAREVDAARRVGGFHTAQVVDADPGAAAPWVASAYIKGPSLERTITDHGPLSEGRVRLLGSGLAEGLAAIHDCGLVHRDLKPSNILMAEDGPRVIDFGIARFADGTRLTDPGVLIGTPAYMSPEQASGARVGSASDVFSLGTVLAYASLGANPFGEGGPEEVMARIRAGDADLAGLPSATRQVVAACLAARPGDRPAAHDLVRVFD
ncbi:hypothetical protein GCM10022254_36050 [Actinomadura meridiana]|uniref:Protein kinase domain-containing protein n=1 Tax=Actinomadura meridiana TaxID=559626 RepID=A0ABP8C4Q5_9ACTN